MLKVAFHTLGCKVNQYETEAVLEMYKQKGYEIVDFEDFADVYVINTCTVTNLGDRKSRQMISKAKSQNNQAVIVIMGCYAQTSPAEISKISGVSLIIGTKDRAKIVGLTEQYIKNKRQINMVDDIFKVKEFEELSIQAYQNRTRAFIKIQEGCNQFCSYCIIPYARGPIRSRSADNVLSEVKSLKDRDFKEVVLTGIHIASYGKDFNNNNGLTWLIKQIEEINGIERIRLSSLEPTLITDEFVSQLKKNKKFCPHFHLSLQSGCNETLKRMNRKYTISQYKEAVNLLRRNFPDVAVTTDIMVGFPGETDYEFEETFNFAKEICFSKIHVFKYSPRKGTPAFKYTNQIDPKIKEQRSKRLIELSNKCEGLFLNRFNNTVQEVLFEQTYKKDQSFIEGLTKNYINVLAKGDLSLIGNIRKVKLNSIKGNYIIGIVEK